ncbi:hypothetical protein niasHT_023329 [Heterodera trifolii]|uniref:Uncharacterized protein n=1 Tax=Heterodera trifolii TaxID=157864 RepID=A0ABD2JDM2_9BILA
MVLRSKKMKSVDALANDLLKCFKPMSPKIGVDIGAEVIQMMEKSYETIRWLEEIQTEQFIKLITGSDEFSAKLKKEIEVSPGERVVKLSNFIKNDQQIIDFFNFLGLNVLLVNEKNEEEQKTPVKKRKAKKKSKTGANSNAPKQLPILAQNDDDNKLALIVDETEGSMDSYKTAFSEQGEASVNNEKKIEEFAEKLETNSENFDEIISDNNNNKIMGRPNKLFKIKDFADDGILMSIYMAFIRALLTQQNGEGDEENQWLTNDLKNGDKWSTNDEMLSNCCANHEQIEQLLNVAVFSNEIAHRLGAQKELTKLLHFHKFGRAIVNDGTIWARLNGEQREKTMLALFNGENAYGTTSFDDLMEKIERMEFQKKIGTFL